MKKKNTTIWIALVMLLAMQLSACKGSVSAPETISSPAIDTEWVSSVQNTESSSGDVNEYSTSSEKDWSTAGVEQSTAGVEQSTADFEQPSATAASVSGSETDDSVPHIVWAVNTNPYNITPEAGEAVNQFLKEKGINCYVDFIYIDETAQDYKAWYDSKKNTGKAPDILSSSIWYAGDLSGPKDFVENDFVPLNDYLETEEGRSLRKAFSEIEWLRTTVNGKIYTVPYRNIDNRYNVLYYWVKDEYKDDFINMFDGSYESVQKIIEYYSDSDLKIIFAGLNQSDLAAFLGCKRLYSMTYQIKTERTIDLTRYDGTKDFLLAFHSDLMAGKVSFKDRSISEEPLPDNTLVYFSGGLDISQYLEGYTKVEFYRAPFNVTPQTSYGVSLASSNTALAVQVLGACYSDPGIASFLFWKYEDPEGWRKQTEYYDSLEEDPLAGFLLCLTEEQGKAMETYYYALEDLIDGIVYNNDARRIVINPKYPEKLEYFFKHPKDYGDLFDTANDQLEKWFEKK